MQLQILVCSHKVTPQRGYDNAARNENFQQPRESCRKDGVVVMIPPGDVFGLKLLRVI
jgi:hypothetical protein